MESRREMVETLVCLYLGDDVFDKDRYITSAFDEEAIEEAYRYYDNMSDSELSEVYRKEMCN